MQKRLVIHVEDKPPEKGQDYSMLRKYPDRVEKLVKAAKVQVKLDQPLTGKINLRITHSRKGYTSDPANIIGGITDGLSKRWNKSQRKEDWGIYEDDSSEYIGLISYTEFNGNKEEYWVEIFY